MSRFYAPVLGAGGGYNEPSAPEGTAAPRLSNHAAPTFRFAVDVFASP